MARVGNIPTVSAYKGNVGQRLMQIGDTLEGISQGFEKKQQTELAEAKKLYTQGLNIGLYNSINELRNDPNLSANPQGLASAMDKVLEKTLADVTDDDVKMNVMVDYQLKKGTYVNQAQTEFNRVQRAKAKSYAYDSVYANIDSMGASFANALTGNSTNDDIANYQHSLNAIKNNINAKNPDGTYIFTDTQRRAMMKDAKSSYMNGFKAVYEQLDDKQKEDIAKSIDDDSFELVKVGSEEKPEETQSIKLKDIVGEDAYKDIKKYTIEQRKKDAKAKLDEIKLMRDEALIETIRTKSVESLNKYKEYSNLAKGDLETLQNYVESSPNYEATTTYEGVKDATKAINEYMEKDFNNDEEMLKSFIAMADKIDRTQQAGILTEDKKKILIDGATETLADKELKKIFQNSVSSINEVMEWNTKQLSGYELGKYKYEHGNQMGGQRRYGFFAFNKNIPAIKNKMADGLQAQMGYIMKGDLESAEKVKRETKKEVLEIMYPEIKGKNVGDTIVVNGKVYKIMSLDDNVALGSK